MATEGLNRKGREAIDAALEPALTDEEKAEQEAARIARLEEEWGTSPEAQAGAATLMQWAGGEG